MSKTSKFLAVALFVTLLALFGIVSISRNEVKFDIPISLMVIGEFNSSKIKKIFQR